MVAGGSSLQKCPLIKGNFGRHVLHILCALYKFYIREECQSRYLSSAFIPAGRHTNMKQRQGFRVNATV